MKTEEVIGPRTVNKGRSIKQKAESVGGGGGMKAGGNKQGRPKGDGQHGLRAEPAIRGDVDVVLRRQRIAERNREHERVFLGGVLPLEEEVSAGVSGEREKMTTIVTLPLEEEVSGGAHSVMSGEREREKKK